MSRFANVTTQVTFADIKEINEPLTQKNAGAFVAVTMNNGNTMFVQESLWNESTKEDDVVLYVGKSEKTRGQLFPADAMPTNSPVTA